MESKKGVIVLGGFIQGLALLRSFAELNIPVYVTESDSCLAKYSRYCSKFLKSPNDASQEFVKFLIEVAKREGLKDWLLIPTNDLQVETLSNNASALQEYYRILVPSPADLYHIINKRNLLEKAEQCGTNTPRTCYLDTIEKAKDFRYPLIIKGNYGCSFFLTMHTKAYKAYSHQELEQVLKSISGATDIHDVMIQEFITLRKNEHVVSFTCFADHGDIKSFWMGQKLRERPLDNGTATFAESIMSEDILDQATPLMKELQYSGVCEIEFIYDHRDNKWELIEINPRTWKWVGLAKACGIDYAKMIYWYSHGIDQKFPKSYKVGVKWVDRLSDSIVGIKMIRKQRMTVTDFFKSMKGNIVSAIWNWKDPIPALYYPIYIISCKLKRFTKKR